MDAEFTYAFVNKYQEDTVAKNKVEWVCTDKLPAIADQVGATSYAYIATATEAKITIGLPPEIAALPVSQRTATLIGLFKGSLGQWIPQINISETIVYI